MQSSTNSTANRSTHDSSRSKSNTPALRVIPLGGLHEIGKNTCVFEYGDELMLVDAGLAFPSDGMHGVNVVICGCCRSSKCCKSFGWIAIERDD